MNRRGRILRDTNVGPGLVTVEGTQYPFTLEGMWLSETPPRMGMGVDVQFDEQGTPRAVKAVSDGQLVQESTDKLVSGVRTHGGAPANSALRRFGASTVTAWLALALGWLEFPAVTIGPRGETVTFTFRRLLDFAASAQAIQNFNPYGAQISSPEMAFRDCSCGSLSPVRWSLTFGKTAARP